jgi:iron complex outermembrane receptor protein
LPAEGYLTLMGDMSYRSDVFFTEFHRALEGQEANAIFDFDLRYTSGSGRLHADAWVRNATDELVASSTFQLSTGRAIGVTYLPPRTYGFSLGYKF